MLRQAFDTQISELKQELVKMGAFVESMLDRAVRSLEEQDVALAEEVIRDDDVADRMDLEIEQWCMKLLALQQPMARDLRTIGTVMKIIADVERMGDYSVDIARATLQLADRPYFTKLENIPEMTQVVGNMLRKALQALVAEDLDLVQEVIAEDDQVDRIWYHLLDKLIGIMEEDKTRVAEATHLLLVARYLERVADHIVNVVERVAYMKTGRLEDLAPSHRYEGSV
jgi:phosphate transport system protein